MKFLTWLGIMLILCLINPSLGLWAIIISGIVWGSDTEKSSVNYGDVTYFSNNIHSVKQGSVTYYSDDNGRRLGRSVDQGNGIHIYFDDDGREIGHSYTSGRITDFIGDCFECR